MSLGRTLLHNGWKLKKIVTLPDIPKEITQEITNAKEKVIITSGGLGPTSDDKTVEALCLLLKCKRVFHHPSLKQIKKKLREKGCDTPTINRASRQAQYPQKGTALLNPFGLAPLITCRWGNKLIFSLPGVPNEFTGLLENTVLPELSHLPKSMSHRFNIYLHDISESEVNSKLEILEQLKQVSLSYLPYLGGVNVIASGDNFESLNCLKEFLYERYSENVISPYGENLSEWIHRHFSEMKLKLGICESCTGGLVISRLVSKPGSSLYVDSGIVSYSDDSKKELLQISPSLLDKRGAVSMPVAKKMLLNLITIRKLDAGISITGIAGPSGGTKKKPLGTVYIGVYYKQTIKVKKHLFKGDREEIQERTFWTALNDLRKLIKRIDGL